MTDLLHEIEILWLAENRYHKGASLKEHSHRDYYQIYYVVESAAEFLVNGTSCLLEENMFIFAHPGVKHGIKPISGENIMKTLEVKFVVFNNDLAAELQNIPHVYRGNADLQNLLYQVFNEGIKKDIYYNKTVVHLFNTFLYKLIRQYKNFDNNPKDITFRQKPAVKIKEYLNLHYQEDISLDRLAEAIGYTKNYLCRIFRENTGITINEYLSDVRISRAADLLASTDMEVSEVSKAAGFTNVFHFIKKFKKIIGIPPGGYRKKALTGMEFASGTVEARNTVFWSKLV
jgi:AraC-like DNA-binding protein